MGDKPDIKKLVEEGSRERFAQLQKSHEDNVAKITGEAAERYDTLLKQHRSVAVDQAISSAILANDGKPNYLGTHLRERATLDDEFNLVLKGGDGHPLMGTDGKPQSLDSYVAELKTDSAWKDAFNAPKASGGGSQGAGSPTFDASGGAKALQPTEGATFL